MPFGTNANELSTRPSHRMEPSFDEGAPLESADVAALVQTRLGQSSASEPGMFSPEAIDAVCSCSGGRRQTARRLIDTAIFLADQEDRDEIDPDLVMRASRSLEPSSVEPTVAPDRRRRGGIQHRRLMAIATMGALTVAGVALLGAYGPTSHQIRDAALSALDSATMPRLIERAEARSVETADTERGQGSVQPSLVRAPRIEEIPTSAPVPTYGPASPAAADADFANDVAAVPASAPNPHAAEIEALLDTALAQAKALKLTTPAGDNALETYTEVLALDPSNADAQEGISFLAVRYVDLSYTAADRGDEARAELYAMKAEELAPTDPRVQGLIESRAQAAAAERREVAQATRAAAIAARPIAASGGRQSGNGPISLLAGN